MAVWFEFAEIQLGVEIGVLEFAEQRGGVALELHIALVHEQLVATWRDQHGNVLLVVHAGRA